MEIREARPEDWPWITRLACEVCSDSLSPDSPLGAAALKARVRQRFQNLDKSPSSPFLGLVAWHFPKAQTQEVRCGYLILQLDALDSVTGEAQSAIFDMAVAPRFQGSPAVRLLVQRAAQITAERGLATMQGDITVSNRKAYLQALRLGFKLQRYSIAMDCRPAP